VITLYSADNSKLMEIERLERSGRDLLIRGNDEHVTVTVPNHNARQWQRSGSRPRLAARR